MDDTRPSEFDRKIVKQIEYYFGDKNLPRDKFLLQKIEEDDGWVTMECMLKFNRLKAIVEHAIADALHKFGSGLLETDESKTKLRRVKALPEQTEEDFALAKEKTIYCKGFPEDTKLDDLETFFEDKGKCIFIKMRRRIDDGKTFKGSVFVEFKTKEEATAFLALEGLKFGDNDLVYMSKDAYFRSKKESKGNNAENGGERTNDIKKETKEESIQYNKGCVLHISGFGVQTSREDIKELFNVDEGPEISWVDFNRGDKEGLVRFTKAGDGEKAIEAVKKANDDKVMLRGVETTLRVLEGDEEKNYWVKLRDFRQHQKKKGWKNSPHSNRKRGRSRRDEKDENSSETPAKQVKTESPAKEAAEKVEAET